MSEKITSIKDEGLSLDYELVRVLLGDKEPNNDEAHALNLIVKALGDDVFKEALYQLTRISFPNAIEAKSICMRIMEHKHSLTLKLDRDIGLVLPAIDYITNIHPGDSKYTCMDQDSAEVLAGSAISDPKTLAYSSALLYWDIEKEIERANRYNTTFTLVFIDIDRFKQVNVAHGHVFGDRALAGIATLINQNLRKPDSVYRYGGDEFVVMLPETDDRRAVGIALKLKNFVTRVEVDGTTAKVTFSIGVVPFDHEKLDKVSLILNKAEEAASKAKDFGGNSICLYKEGRFSRLGLEPGKKRSRTNTRSLIRGEVIVSGTVSGRVFKYEDNITRELKIYSITEEETEKEYERIKSAIRMVEEDMGNIMSLVENKLDKKQMDIFEVHRYILKDQAMLEKIEAELKTKKLNSEAIVKYFFEEWETKFDSFDTPELRSKASDIADLGRRILRKLTGIKTSALDELPEEAILFSTRILPTDIVHLKKSNLRAIVTQKGSRYSHAAILAKALEIPFISKIDTRMELIPDGAPVIIDGYKGHVILNPTKTEIEASEKQREKTERLAHTERTGERLEYRKRKISIYANIETSEDVSEAARHHCDGVGLTRLEYVYIMRQALPTLEELHDELANLYEPVMDKPVTIRLLDIGGDKLLPYMNESSMNLSKMGIRGIRYLLRNPEILDDQLIAFLRLSDRMQVRVLIPMVTVPAEIEQVKTRLKLLKKKAGSFNMENIKVGAMIEVPSAVLAIDEILPLVDFISIGSNDLVQYTMAADREEAEVSDYYEQGNSLIIRSIEYVVRRARESNIECSLCGELAGDMRYTEKLLESGLSRFSVAPYLIPKLRRKIRSLVPS
jgi:phosphoenolpyruvate-protein phosphotransferase